MLRPTLLQRGAILVGGAAVLGWLFWTGYYQFDGDAWTAKNAALLALLGAMLFFLAWRRARNAKEGPKAQTARPTDEAPSDAPSIESEPAWHDPAKKPLFRILMAIGVAVMVVGNLVLTLDAIGGRALPLGAAWWFLLGVPLIAVATVLYYRHGPREGVVWQSARDGPVRVDLARQRRALPLLYGGIAVAMAGVMLANGVASAYATPVALGGFAIGMGMIFAWVFASRAPA